LIAAFLKERQSKIDEYVMDEYVLDSLGGQVSITRLSSFLTTMSLFKTQFEVQVFLPT